MWPSRACGRCHVECVERSPQEAHRLDRAMATVVRMKACHVVVRLRSGAGDTPWRRRTFPTVWSETSNPRLASAPHNPVIAPRAVLFGHANNQLLNCPLDPGSAWASMLRAIELARDEPSVPSQNSIRQSGSRYVAECLAAQSTTNLAELRSLGVRASADPSIGLSGSGSQRRDIHSAAAAPGPRSR
jgi:hypothetical protein